MEGLEVKNAVVREYKELAKKRDALIHNYLTNYEKWSYQKAHEKQKEIDDILQKMKDMRRAHKYLIAKEWENELWYIYISR